MSSFNGVAGDNELASSMNVLLRKEDGSCDRGKGVHELDFLLLELREESSALIPDLVGDDFEDTGQVKEPANLDRAVKIEKPDKSRKKGKSKKKGAAKSQGKIGGRRGIETLLRNAYRAQLDMLSLAAVKANIMISLNGLLISMLIISGSHFITVDVWFSIPIMLFLLCSAVATIFAVLAARPDVSRNKFSPEDFNNGNAHLLAFEEFSDLSEKQYVEAMSRMLEDDEQIYKNMISHVHELGSTADRKYRNLHCSYTVFICGIILSITSLLILEGMKWTNHLPPQ